MTPVGYKSLTAFNSIPYLHGLVKAGRCHPCAVRRPYYTDCRTLMTCVGQDGLHTHRRLATNRCIPDPHGLINACRCEVFPIWRPSYTHNCTRMTCVGKERFGRGSFGGWSLPYLPGRTLTYASRIRRSANSRSWSLPDP